MMNSGMKGPAIKIRLTEFLKLGETTQVACRLLAAELALQWCDLRLKEREEVPRGLIQCAETGTEKGPSSSWADETLNELSEIS